MSTIALNTSSAIGNAAAADTGAPVRIAVKNLNFHYGDFRSLKDISLDFYDRQVTALIGPSGCGKSTLLRTFNRIYSLYPEQRADGQILLDGRALAVDRRERASRTGRHGVPEADAVSHVDLRQHRLRHQTL
jgi:phosphate transport system ATP-binding protein